MPYPFTVTNTGNVTLTGLTVTDPKCDAAPTLTSGDTNADSKLQLAETWVYTCNHTVTQAEIDAGGNLSNTVTVDSAESAPDTSTLNIPVAQSPSIDVVKSSTTASVTTAGQVVPYTFTVTNTGNVTLTGITVADPKCAAAPVLSAGDANADSKLQLAETWVYGCSHTVTQAEIDAGGNLSNTVTADSAESAPATSTLNIPVTQSPSIHVVKSLDDRVDHRGGPGGALHLHRHEHGERDADRHHGHRPEVRGGAGACRAATRTRTGSSSSPRPGSTAARTP